MRIHIYECWNLEFNIECIRHIQNDHIYYIGTRFIKPCTQLSVYKSMIPLLKWGYNVIDDQLLSSVSVSFSGIFIEKKGHVLQKLSMSVGRSWWKMLVKKINRVFKSQKIFEMLILERSELFLCILCFQNRRIS